MSPLVDPFAIDRFAHLLGARGVDAPLRLVELDTRRLEVKTTEFEDATYVRIEIIDQVLVLDTQHLALRDLVPVGHELDIAAIVTADVVEAV